MLQRCLFVIGFLLVFLSFSNTSQGQIREDRFLGRGDCESIRYYIRDNRRLDTAYAKNDFKATEVMFDEWSNCDQDRLQVYEAGRASQPEIIKNAYAIFEDFYTPQDMMRVTSGRVGNDTYKDAKYIMVQGTIYLTVRKTINRPGGHEYLCLPNLEIILEEFVPNISVPGKKIIFLNSHRDTLLTRFLGSEHHPLGEGGIMNPAHAGGESAKRLEFLNHYFRSFHGHWGGYWHLVTFPHIFIDFNEDYTEANVGFRANFAEGGSALYKKTDGVWKLIRSRLTWIE
ncbi:hypothetical protein HY967_04060 [Candidatus Jorgensenbacteria bacterium]|nr:hypothetical protein [Candidatus Jorgensenbacteria bacterium]